MKKIGLAVCYDTRKSDRNNKETGKQKSNIIVLKINLDIKKPDYMKKKQPEIIYI